MVKSTITFWKSGLQAWIIQRISAFFITLYISYILYFFIKNQEITYKLWISFLSCTYTKVLTIISLICLLMHSWIGLWIISNDYIKNNYIRMIIQIFISLISIVYTIITLKIIWSI